MKQTLVLAVFSFAMAVAGGTWFAAYLAPPQVRPGLDSRPAAVVAAPGPRQRPTPDITPAPAPREGSAPSDGLAPDPMAAPPIKLPAETAADAAERAKGVAKIIASMKPKAAAEIIARLSDDEVERIVRQLSPKQVAALLAALPQDRAAGLSRRLLNPIAGRQGGL